MSAPAFDVDAYIFIKAGLKTPGWSVRNQTPNPDGQVWTQNECLARPEIETALKATRPEYTVSSGASSARFEKLGVERRVIDCVSTHPRLHPYKGTIVRLTAPLIVRAYTRTRERATMDMRARILEDIRKHPGTWRTAISHRLKVNGQTVSRHIRALLEEKLIRSVKKANLLELFPAEEK